MSGEKEIIPGWWAAPDDYDHGDWGVWRRVRDRRGWYDQLIVGCIPEGMARHWAASDRLAAVLRAVVAHHDGFIESIIGPELMAIGGDPPEIAEARRVLKELEGETV